ncbi:DUF5522 domain-containing protein [Nitriliruptor alkaliphilus]|uniref:DUF5522 domain-containing protein n=1 Tax=Nitriliruptor alkaliphilus TaxID=427918 RepID=UPI001B803A0F|nr:DUF5522 domain-containing protein [Nitriliruptor alkaliphilus]
MDPVPRGRRVPLTERLDPRRTDHAAIVAAHEAAIQRDDDGYIDPSTGYFVFTAQTLWDRGDCCHSGCRHCPFEDGERAGLDGRPVPGQPERGTE